MEHLFVDEKLWNNSRCNKVCVYTHKSQPVQFKVLGKSTK